MTLTESDVVRYETVGSVGVVTLCAAESRNALSPDLMVGLSESLSRVAEDQLGAVVLASSGPVFCSGGDLLALHSAMDGDVDARVGAMVDQFHGVIRSLRRLPVPSIAALSGPAVGGGMALALATDIRVAGQGAAFVTGYIAVGASPDGGASFHLARALGGPPALASMLLNRRINAPELAASGLVDLLVEASEVLPTAIECANQLKELSMPAISAMRQLVYSASSHSLDEHLDAEKEHFIRLAHTPEFKSSVARFAESR